MALFLIILTSNERDKRVEIHFDIIQIEEDFMVFKAVSPANQGLAFGSRFLAEMLNNRAGVFYEITVLDEGTISERIKAAYIG